MPSPASMPPPARHVRRLHVRAESAEDSRRAAVLIGDALHTASLPGADEGRLVVIRRLALGRIPRHASPGTAALLIECRVRESLSAAVWYDRLEARQADIVQFPSRAEAIVQLAKRHARGAPAEEWYWVRIVPEWSALASRQLRWNRLLALAHDLEDAPVVAAAIVGEAITAGALGEMLAAVPPGAGLQWMRTVGWAIPENLPHRLPDQPLLRRPAHIAAARLAAGTWSPNDERSIWLTALLAVAEQPARAAQTDLSSLAAVWLERAISTGPPVSPSKIAAPAMDTPPRFAPADSPRNAPRLKPHPTTTPREDEVHPRLASETHRDRPPAAAVAPGDAPAVRAPMERADESAEIDTNAAARDPGGEPTAFGGLFFLVTVLRRLRFGAFLERNPRLLDAGFAARLLLRAGQGAGMPEDDPLAILLTADLAACEPPTVRARRQLRAWTIAADRWCRRHDIEGLRALVHRPARAHIARSQIDICFPLENADLAVRRLALDVDPGWIPWLGRVIRFHYVARYELGP